MFKCFKAAASTERSDTSDPNVMIEFDRRNIGRGLPNKPYQGGDSNANKLPKFEVKMREVTVASELPYYECEEDWKNIYKNFSTPKGLVLIINNKTFDYLQERCGTDKDEKNLKWLFTKLNYEITETKKDRTAKEMMDDVREFANNPKHANADSCIVVVLSHGAYDELAGTDYLLIIKDPQKVQDFDKKYPLTVKKYRKKLKKFKNARTKNNYDPTEYGRVDTHEFLRCFNSENGNAENLAHKPKLFFFQACRGDDPGRFIAIDDINEPLIHGTQAYGPIFGSNKKPIGADFIVCYSTASKHVSYRK
ncbi:hypothetical protein WR25_14982 [Diploscapter pachys]|uniref:Caspase family p20 domain-containing protein n=1 Tax=Diploscapter pachys TaxID=2018661 RepID=A0A2A2L2X5_9BILA|nr:hypothetical protein WR25_14982 [Diploscapter pachys]